MAAINKVRVNFVRRSIPRRGPFSTEGYNASMEELAVDLADFASRWNTEAYPILNGLPRGSEETRWVSATDMPDPVSDGLDGDHIFVDNDASLTQDDGLFWDSSKLRPKTIRESSRDIDDRITSIYSELSDSLLSVSNGLSQDQWNRLGMWVKDGTASLTTSVSYKARTGWDRLSTLMGDIFEAGVTDLGTLEGTGYTLEEMVTNLLELHNGSWNTDTSGLDHSSITGITQDSVDASSSYAKRARGYSPDANNTEEDLNRMRYEIARTRIGGKANESTGQWNADVTDPVDSGVACLEDHVGYAGHGTQDSENPHGIHRQDVDGLDIEFAYTNAYTGKSGLGSEMPTYSSHVFIVDSTSLETAIGALDAGVYAAMLDGSNEMFYMRTFIGKSGSGSEMPTYTSTHYVSNSTNLETAIGTLDTALYNHSINLNNPHEVTALQVGACVREVYDFSGHTDAGVEIVINHNHGSAGWPNAAYPLVQVVDTQIGGDYGVLVDEVYKYEQEMGIVTADSFVSIEYIDENTFHVYTNVNTGKIIAVF